MSRGEIRPGYWKFELKVKHCIGQTNRARILNFGLRVADGVHDTCTKDFLEIILDIWLELSWESGDDTRNEMVLEMGT